MFFAEEHSKHTVLIEAVTARPLGQESHCAKQPSHIPQVERLGNLTIAEPIKRRAHGGHRLACSRNVHKGPAMGAVQGPRHNGAVIPAGKVMQREVGIGERVEAFTERMR